VSYSNITRYKVFGVTVLSYREKWQPMPVGPERKLINGCVSEGWYLFNLVPVRTTTRQRE
jgi:hypothetical protein